MIEFATIQDKKELSDLWQITFLEDFQVIEKFFQTVFPSVITPVIKIDNEIASALFLLPKITKIATRGSRNTKAVFKVSALILNAT